MLNILSVSQLTAAIKQKLEVSFASISVRGEVSNLKIQSSGHIYFTLKDAGSQVSAVLFKGNSFRLSQPLKEGDQIVVSGELSVYVPRGGYQIIVREVEFSGVGELLKKWHALKLKLEAQGWFDPAKKRPLPKLPRTIGVVTSPTGAVIQDMLHILSRRYSGFHLILNPVRVQGELAAAEIAKAIQDFNTYQLADVLIVGRGGGSIEDLWPFNEEIVAAAIHQSRIPIISAVGHETDFTIADFVADLRAPTPSAAAELVTLEKNQLILQLRKAKTGILQALQTHLRSHRRMLDTITKQSPLRSPYMLLGSFIQKVDDIRADLKMSILQSLSQNRRNLTQLIRQKEALRPGSQIAVQRKNFSKIGFSIEIAAKKQIEQKKRRLEQLVDHLRAIDPRNLLKKGYSIVFHEKKDSVILSINDVEPNDGLRIQVSNGTIRVKVQE
ncbi:MAG: exodeoxyribonuclease VII large subunit [Verrucomicrobia bacterium]|nr:exodeoxyribonuclease VII large subunit [Verrucomicrobiota bacterium]